MGKKRLCIHAVVGHYSQLELTHDIQCDFGKVSARLAAAAELKIQAGSP